MIVVRTTLKVLPEKQLEVLQTLLLLIAPKETESGCKSYCAFCDITDKNRFVLLEEWKNQKDLDRHIGSQRFGVLLGTRALLSAPPQIQIHMVSHTAGMDMVDAVRHKKS